MNKRTRRHIVLRTFDWYIFKLMMLVCTASLMIFSSLNALAEAPANFNSAKKIARELWLDVEPNSFYCGCKFRKSTELEKELINGNLVLDVNPIQDCLFHSEARDAKRTKKGCRNTHVYRIDFEHIVPQAHIEKRIKNPNNQKKAKGDLFNLVPVIGALNNGRNNHPYGEIEGESREYGDCDFEVKNKSAEPMESIRGDLARATLYMTDKYQLEMSDSEISLMKKWNCEDAVSQSELNRHKAISKIMGWNNEYVTNYRNTCLQ